MRHAACMGDRYERGHRQPRGGGGRTPVLGGGCLGDARRVSDRCACCDESNLDTFRSARGSGVARRNERCVRGAMRTRRGVDGPRHTLLETHNLKTYRLRALRCAECVPEPTAISDLCHALAHRIRSWPIRFARVARGWGGEGGLGGKPRVDRSFSIDKRWGIRFNDGSRR